MTDETAGSVDAEAVKVATQPMPDEIALEIEEKAQKEAAKQLEKAGDEADDPAESDDADGDQAEAEAAAQDEDDTDGDDAAEGDDDADEDEDPKPRKKSAGKRIAELTRARRAAERERDAAFAERDQLRQAMHKPADQPEDKGPPKPADFDTYDDYVNAAVEYRAGQIVDQRLAGLGEKSQKAAAQAQQRALATRYQEQAAQAREKYDDFDDVTSSESLRITPTMAQAIAEHEHGAEVAYHLGNNPAEASEIAGLSDVQQIIRLERIASRLTAKPRPKPTAAPDPAKPVRASRPGARARRPEDAGSMDEYARLRNKRPSN